MYSMLHDVGTVLIFAGLPALVMFVARYALKSPWKTTAAGRAIMQLALSLTAIYVLVAMNGLYGSDWPFRGWVRLLVYLAVALSLWRLYFTLRRIQRGASLAPTRPPEETRGMAEEEDDGRTVEEATQDHMADMGSKPPRAKANRAEGDRGSGNA